jgi:methylenetetrahydrofolate reductase (NADPH)
MAAALLRNTEGALFGCCMCGSCLLPETGFICPMTCPRGLRNGPCRGASPERCFIEPERCCVWFDIFQRAEQENRLDGLLEIYPPLDPAQLGRESLASSLRSWCNCRSRLWRLLSRREEALPEWQAYRARCRCQGCWQGDGQFHPPAYIKPISKLETMLRDARFPITVEVAPPIDPSGKRIVHLVGCLKGGATAAAFTDNPLGVPRMSGLACALICLEHGLEPLLQLQTRHRNRYDIEAEAVGAAALGVSNILCLTDDIGRFGPGPRARPEINDLDAIQALWMLRRLRDEGINIDGQPVEPRPVYFLGAMASPTAVLPRYEAIVTEKKINAGAQFLQTLPIFDLRQFDQWIAALARRQLLDKVHLIATVACLHSPRHARFMANDVPGVYIPPAIMSRMERAADPAEEGLLIALELMVELYHRRAVDGLHLLAPYHEEVVPRLFKGLRFRLAMTRPAPHPDSRSGHQSLAKTRPPHRISKI